MESDWHAKGIHLGARRMSVLASPFEERDCECVCYVHRTVDAVHRNVNRARTLLEQWRGNPVSLTADHQRASFRQPGFKNVGGRGRQFQRDQGWQRIAPFEKLRGCPKFPFDQHIAIARGALDALPILGCIFINENDARTTDGIGNPQYAPDIFQHLQTGGDDDGRGFYRLARAHLFLPRV